MLAWLSAMWSSLAYYMVHFIFMYGDNLRGFRYSIWGPISNHYMDLSIFPLPRQIFGPIFLGILVTGLGMEIDLKLSSSLL